MSSEGSAGPRTSGRREPPRFRRVLVRAFEQLTPRMQRIVLGGPELQGFEVPEPASSVRLLLPPPGGDTLVMPEWDGNQFKLPTGERAPIRTFTPRHLDTERLELTLDIVVHEGGVASEWARSAEPGLEAAVSGPGRGYALAATAPAYLLAGDETAIPAISQMLERLPAETPVRVHIEVADASARLELPSYPKAEVTWHELAPGSRPGDALVAAVEAIEQIPGAAWVAGEAASVQRIRKHLFDVRGMARSAATVRGYWKMGRSAT
ncbi:MAG TPA: siderophore-interacting protein [Acidimicrobiales bacterium]|nr:siderophore-interacting protein [Acidimicrobiales bacterium]